MLWTLKALNGTRELYIWNFLKFKLCNFTTYNYGKFTDISNGVDELLVIQ